VQELYGDSFEDNDVAASAASLGIVAQPLTSMRTLVSNASIGNPCSDVDWFSFTLVEEDSIRLALVPFGMPYLEGPQDAYCNSGTLYDPRKQLNLRLSLGASEAAMQSRDVEGLGGVEYITIMLPAGSYLIRVDVASPDNSCPNFIQGYELRIGADDGPYTPTTTTTTSGSTTGTTGGFPTTSGGFPSSTGGFPTTTGGFPSTTGGFPTSTSSSPTTTTAAGTTAMSSAPTTSSTTSPNTEPTSTSASTTEGVSSLGSGGGQQTAGAASLTGSALVMSTATAMAAWLLA